MKVPLTRPLIGEEELERVADVLRSGWLTQGPRVGEFEAAVARAAGVGEAVATTSCTTALHLALRAHEIGPGDDVVCPSYTWIATPNAVRMAGARPVFADVDPATMNVTAETLERALTPKTRALLLVHQFGLPCDLDAAAELARGHGLTVIEDAACALGSRYRGAPIGAHGSTTCFLRR